MGLIMKKDDSEDNEYIDGIEVIGRGEGPNGDPEDDIEMEVHEGLTAEDISGKTAARDADRETEADPELLEGVCKPAGCSDEAAGADRDARSDADADKGPVRDHSADSPIAPSRPAASGNRHKLYIAIAVIAVIVAAVLGYVLGSGGLGPKGLDSSMITEEQLDTTVATWTKDGKTNTISARQAIESQYSLDSVKGDDDTYPAPSAEMIVAYARNQILLAEAKEQGITVDDDELATAAEETLGTSDFEVIADKYQVSEDQAKDIVREQVIIQKFYQTVVEDAPTVPVAPEEPENGDSSTTSAAYAAYIIDLAGDEWDEEAGAWASEDGAYASALSGEEFTADSASYAQAQKAYAVASQEYATKASSASQDWTAYVNELFAKADLTVYGLYA